MRIDTSAQGQSWDNEVINKQQFEDGLRQNETKFYPGQFALKKKRLPYTPPRKKQSAV